MRLCSLTVNSQNNFNSEYNVNNVGQNKFFFWGGGGRGWGRLHSEFEIYLQTLNSEPGGVGVTLFFRDLLPSVNLFLVEEYEVISI